MTSSKCANFKLKSQMKEFIKYKNSKAYSYFNCCVVIMHKAY